jgi:hypothetical protein
MRSGGVRLAARAPVCRCAWTYPRCWREFKPMMTQPAAWAVCLDCDAAMCRGCGVAAYAATMLQLIAWAVVLVTEELCS